MERTGASRSWRQTTDLARTYDGRVMARPAPSWCEAKDRIAKDRIRGGDLAES